ncbi:MAG TPA: hypothetical protein VIQ30_14485, partial [Pseudonocardia sp.]
MAQDSWPAPGHNSGALTEAEWERVAVRFTDNGVYGTPADLPVVVPGTGLSVTVKSERSAGVRGFNWYSGSVDYTHTIPTNVAGQTRVDRIVLRLDRSDWTVRSIRKAGTAGAGAPALQQDTGSTGLYEIPLAQVTIGNNASSLTVQREELFVGSRVRTCTSTTRPPNPTVGDTAHETDTGKWIGWNGSAWVTIFEDSGLLDLTIGFATVWEFSAATRGRKINGTVSLRLAVKRKGEDFAVGDADGSHVVTVPAALRPYQFEYGHVGFTNGAVGTAEVRPDGQVWVK